MPWTAGSFKTKHNKKLSGGQAAKAARVGNALLKQGASEGKAIRIANAVAEGTVRRNRGTTKKYAGGGKVAKVRGGGAALRGLNYKTDSDGDKDGYKKGGAVKTRGSGAAKKGTTHNVD